MLALLFVLLQTDARAPRPPRPPNIVHVLADDVAWDDFSCYGSHDLVTPNIDRIASEGMRFTDFYAPSSTCTPSRAAILTGCYAQRVGLPQVLFPNSEVGLAEGEVTIAELLKGRGYATALVGKWHLGHLPQFLPTRHGFDLFFGLPYPNDHGPERLTAKEPRVSRGFPAIPLLRGESVVEQPAQLASLPERFVAEARRFIAEHKDGPFYLQLSNIETHTPWFVPQRFQYKSRSGVYGDAVACLDWSVGELLDELARQGLDGDTLVVVSADNGPLVHRYPELEGIYGHAATVDPERRHRLREGKYQGRYEGGTRVACVARWPGHVAPGGVSSELVAGFDLFTTFARLAGAEVPADRIVDGHDLSPLLLGRSADFQRRDTLFHYENFELVAVRHGNWKLVLPRKPGEQPELYDLAADASETTDQAQEQADIVERLLALCERAREDLGDSKQRVEGLNRRPAGKLVR
ncbi:MAG: sulfatase [Candidatus Rokubacteria bacterium]|nr:sulfatase [Candidatus Rokubacteria bacterium]